MHAVAEYRRFLSSVDKRFFEVRSSEMTTHPHSKDCTYVLMGHFVYASFVIVYAEC